ncbi:myb-like protein X isoform X3 [Hydra vulgaris]|uniref:Myb-like protein X isoform X3 n=2 Tax=Hydra vulgaris TaxID=6087 RepID=A0ABM4CH31_HYDVU
MAQLEGLIEEFKVVDSEQESTHEENDDDQLEESTSYQCSILGYLSALKQRGLETEIFLKKVNNEKNDIIDVKTVVINQMILNDFEKTAVKSDWINGLTDNYISNLKQLSDNNFIKEKQEEKKEENIEQKTYLSLNLQNGSENGQFDHDQRIKLIDEEIFNEKLKLSSLDQEKKLNSEDIFIRTVISLQRNYKKQRLQRLLKELEKSAKLCNIQSATVEIGTNKIYMNSEDISSHWREKKLKVEGIPDDQNLINKEKNVFVGHCINKELVNKEETPIYKTQGHISSNTNSIISVSLIETQADPNEVAYKKKTSKKSNNKTPRDILMKKDQKIIDSNETLNCKHERAGIQKDSHRKIICKAQKDAAKMTENQYSAEITDIETQNYDQIDVEIQDLVKQTDIKAQKVIINKSQDYTEQTDVKNNQDLTEQTDIKAQKVTVNQKNQNYTEQTDVKTKVDVNESPDLIKISNIKTSKSTVNKSQNLTEQTDIKAQKLTVNKKSQDYTKKTDAKNNKGTVNKIQDLTEQIGIEAQKAPPNKSQDYTEQTDIKTKGDVNESPDLNEKSNKSTVNKSQDLAEQIDIKAQKATSIKSQVLTEQIDVKTNKVDTNESQDLNKQTIIKAQRAAVNKSQDDTEQADVKTIKVDVNESPDLNKKSNVKTNKSSVNKTQDLSEQTDIKVQKVTVNKSQDYTKKTDIKNNKGAVNKIQDLSEQTAIKTQKATVNKRKDYTEQTDVKTKVDVNESSDLTKQTGIKTNEAIVDKSPDLTKQTDVKTHKATVSKSQDLTEKTYIKADKVAVNESKDITVQTDIKVQNSIDLEIQNSIDLEIQCLTKQLGSTKKIQRMFKSYISNKLSNLAQPNINCKVSEDSCIVLKRSIVESSLCFPTKPLFNDFEKLSSQSKKTESVSAYSDFLDLNDDKPKKTFQNNTLCSQKVCNENPKRMNTKVESSFLTHLSDVKSDLKTGYSIDIIHNENDSNNKSDSSNSSFDYNQEVDLDQFEFIESMIENMPNQKFQESKDVLKTVQSKNVFHSCIDESWVRPCSTIGNNDSPNLVATINNARYISQKDKKTEIITKDWGINNRTTAKLILKRAKKMEGKKKRGLDSHSAVSLNEKVKRSIVNMDEILNKKAQSMVDRKYEPLFLPKVHPHSLSTSSSSIVKYST